MITQSMFTRARAAAITTSLVYWGTSMVEQFVNKDGVTMNLKTLGSLSPPVAMIETVAVLARYEQSGVGVRWHNIDALYNEYSVKLGLIMMAVNSVVLICVGTYLEQVAPKTVGVRRHPCFFCLPNFWKEMFNCKRKKEVKPSGTKKISPGEE